MVSRRINFIPWNKGLTKKTNKKIMAASKKLKLSHIGKINPNTKKIVMGNIDIKKAYILGCLCGDASVLSNVSYGRITSGSIRLVCKDKDFALAFKKCLNKSFKDSFFRRHGNEKLIYTGIASTSLVKEIIERWGFFKTKTWKIPNEIKNSTDKIKGYFLRGLFDSDGSVNKKYGYIRIQKINYIGLKEVHKLLEDIGIKSNFRFSKITSKKNKVYEIDITHLKDRKIFLTKIGFEIKRKLNRLKEGIKRNE